MMTIEVLSPCVIGIDDGDELSVDLATVVDQYGMPSIPRNRVSARLRDSALRLFTESVATDADLADATALFGAGHSTDDHRRVVTVGHATLPAAVRASVTAAIENHEARFRTRKVRRNIRDAYTTRIVRTARDSRGAPVAGSLRDIEAVRPGVVWEAALRWHGEPTATQLTLFARCVLALTQIGSGETDFNGRVQCTLDGDRDATVALAYPREQVQ